MNSKFSRIEEIEYNMITELLKHATLTNVSTKGNTITQTYKTGPYNPNRVLEDLVNNKYVVSTVKISDDTKEHDRLKGKHVYDTAKMNYETMVFIRSEGFNHIDVKRYATIEESKKGHKELVTKYTNKK